MFKLNSPSIKGILLVSGTCIGAGMIGVPVKTAAAGFYPTIIAFVIVWLIMTCSALLLLEVSLYFPGENNFVSMTKAIFGKIGQNIIWGVCLLFMYSLMAAYASGGATMISKLLPVNVYLAAVIFMIPFAIIIFLGSKWVGLINKYLTLAVITSFVLLCINTIFGSPTLQPVVNLSVIGNFKSLVYALPLIVVTFGYHEIIPPLKSYLKEEVASLKMAILIGSAIPFIVYVIWQVVILLLIPAVGPNGLISMLDSNQNPGDNLVNYLLQYNNNNNILFFVVSFSSLSLICSLTTCAWALFDFFADGLGILKNKTGKMILSFLTFIPPIIYALIFPQGFLKALGLAGAFSAIIMIIYPALMAWKLRREIIITGNSSLPGSINIKYKAPVNKVFLGIIFLFGILIVFLECINNF